MQHYWYLLGLIISLSGVALADYRLKLAFFWKPVWVTKIIAAAVAFFLLWDIVGINLHVFATNQQWVSGFNLLTPNLPVEEILFLAFLSYLTVVVWRLLCSRTVS